MEDRRKYFEQLSPKQLEQVAGGMVPDIEARLREDIEKCKLDGISRKDLEDMIRNASTEYTASLEEIGITREALLACIDTRMRRR